MPEELDEVERKIKQLEIEKQAVLREKDDASKERLAALEQDLAQQNQLRTELRAHWQVEKDLIQSIRKLKDLGFSGSLSSQGKVVSRCDRTAGTDAASIKASGLGICFDLWNSAIKNFLV